MKFYLVNSTRGHFQLFTNKKDANAYKKEHDWPEYGNEFEVSQVVIKNKNDVLHLVNILSGEPEEAWQNIY